MLHVLIYRNKQMCCIIDTMADVQSMDKPSWIKTCKDLSAHFIALHLCKENMMRYILCLTGMTYKITKVSNEAFTALVILTLCQITAQTLQIFQMFH